MSPDPEDPLFRVVLTLDDAKRLFLEHAMGMHTYRVGWGGQKYEATFTDVFATRKEERRRPMDTALSIIRREVLCKNITVATSRWGSAYIVLFTPAGTPIAHEAYGSNDLQRFCLRVLELCAAWEGVDRHLDT